MKKLFTSISFLLVSNFVFGQIEWASTGTKWWYYFKFDNASPMITEIESAGQATISGKNCKIITASDLWNTDTIYTYEENGKVYNASVSDAIFFQRYDFNAEIGDSWINTGGAWGNDTLTFHVGTIFNMVVDGISFQLQNVTTTRLSLPDNSAYEWVIVGMGSKESFGPPYPTDLTVEGFPGLGCFRSVETGLISLDNILDCHELSPVGFVHENKTSLNIFPNPTSEHTTLSFTLPSGTLYSVQIFNSFGQKVQEHQLPIALESLLIDDLQAGLYFVVLLSSGQPIKTKKLLRF